MMNRACMQQPDILTAMAEGRALPEVLESHLASCPSCREQVEAVAFVRQLADTPDASHPLPDPAVIWWKAQLLRRWQAERVASTPIERMRWVELAAGVASLAVFLVWQWQGLVSLASRAIPAVLAAVSAAPQGANPLALVLVAGASASIGAMVLAGLHRRLSRTTL
jgi:predicted anti-sigma-YlaC factor YlaD